MANWSLFGNTKARSNQADTLNLAGGVAYSLPPKHALAQLAATGCFNGTYYASAESQLNAFKTLVDQVNDIAYLAKLAIYARQRAGMKDMPVALLATLAARDTALFHKIFDRVVDNGKQLRTLFQMIRSGQFGKQSLTSSVQRAFQRWLTTASVEKLLSASIGHDPSLRDVFRLARPKPKDNSQRAFFGWLTDKETAKWAPASEADLPEQVKLLQQFRHAENDDQQVELLDKLKVRFDQLADKAKGTKVWAAIARTMGPQALRMNLNTLQRHGVLADETMVRYIADRLADADEIHRSKQFPYQYFAAYLNASAEMPAAIKKALHQAAETACGNIPELPAPVIIGLDVSGSMSSSVTGNRGGGTSKMRCIDVAALFAAALLRRNPDSIVVPFDTAAYQVKIDPNDSILSLAERLAKYGGGGTDCAQPLILANREYTKRKLSGVILVSDNESWIYADRIFGTGLHGATGVSSEWNKFAQTHRNLTGSAKTDPKLICIDLQPNQTTQAKDRRDTLNIGGFSDAVFDVITSFLRDETGRFVAEVEAIELNT